MQLVWALHNMKLDREESRSEAEDLVFLAGMFTNFELAQKMAQAKKEKLQGVETIEEEVRRVAEERASEGMPRADADVRAHILERAGMDADLATLGDLAERYEEDAGSGND